MKLERNINEILSDTINFLKFQQEHTSYDIFENYIDKNNLSDDDININITLIDKQNTEENLKPQAVKDKAIKRVSTGMSLLREDWMDCEAIETLDKKICKCQKCPLGKTRKNFVFGTGNPDADVVIVGEAPGADEDTQGKPFVGRAGQLLTDILKAINFSRDEVFICNILKCRPPGNRNPLPEEINLCEPYLFKQLELIKPKFILAVGTFASQTLLKKKEPLGKLRGKFYDFEYEGGIAKLMVTFHPAALLRNPNWKRPTWEDVQLFRKEYDKE